MRVQPIKKYARAFLACISFAIAAVIGLSLCRKRARHETMSNNGKPENKVAVELTGTSVQLYGAHDVCINPDTELELTSEDLNDDATALIKTRGATTKTWLTPSGKALTTGAAVVIDDIIVNKLGIHKTKRYSKSSFGADRLAVKLDQLLK